MGASGATWATMGCVAGRGHSWSRCSPEGPKGPVSAFNEWEQEHFTVIPIITLFIFGSRHQLVSSAMGSQ